MKPFVQTFWWDLVRMWLNEAAFCSSASAGQRKSTNQSEASSSLVGQASSNDDILLSLPFIFQSLSLALSQHRSDHVESAHSFITHAFDIHSSTHPHTHSQSSIMHARTHTHAHAHFSSFDVSSGIVTRYERAKMRFSSECERKRECVWVHAWACVFNGLMDWEREREWVRVCVCVLMVACKASALIVVSGSGMRGNSLSQFHRMDANKGRVSRI